jgi:dipeptidyl aminopeptidase/acylaminoacyl peptidase
MLTIRRAGLLAALCSATAAAQNPNPTNLWLVELKWTGGKLTTSAPVKLTHDDGPNSQPSFSPDGKAVIFSANRDTGATARSDIYRIDLATRTERRVTRTPENENSPTVNEKGEYVAVRWNPVTLFKEFGPWVYNSDGTPARGVLRAPDTTGYYTPLPNGNYALTRPKSKTFTLGLFDAQTGAIVDVDSGLPALPAVRIPGENALTYVQIDSVDGKHTIRRVDLATRKTSTIGRSVIGRTAHAWVAGQRTMLMAKGNRLFARTAGETTWRVVATFTDPELRNASAYVVSPQGDKLILTSPKRLGVVTMIRDSVEEGMDLARLVATFVELDRKGGLAGVDMNEGPISAFGDDRMQKNRFDQGLAVHVVATALFPRSWRAFSRLGDAQRKAGDSTQAVRSWSKALQLNTRSTDGEKAAADSLERKISGRP